MIIRSKSSKSDTVNPGDLVNVSVRHHDNNRGKFSSPRTVLSFNHSSGLISVLGNHGKPVSVAIENVRLAPGGDEFSQHVSESNDQLDSILETEIDESSGSQHPSPYNINVNRVRQHLQL